VSFRALKFNASLENKPGRLAYSKYGVPPYLPRKLQRRCDNAEAQLAFVPSSLQVSRQRLISSIVSS
jgi:hypothetical protein